MGTGLFGTNLFALPDPQYKTPSSQGSAPALPCSVATAGVGAAPAITNPRPARLVTAATVLLPTDDIVFLGQPTTPASFSVTLPNRPPAGTRLELRDISGVASQYPITVVPQGVDLIDGSPSMVINVNGGRRQLVYDTGNGAQAAQWRVTVQDIPLSDNPFMHRRVASTALLTLAATDFLVSCDPVTAGGAMSLRLPQTPAPGTTIIVEDVTGGAGASPITVNTQLPDSFGPGELVSVPGSVSAVGSEVIAAAYGSRVFYFDGAKWHVVMRSIPLDYIRPGMVGASVTLGQDDGFVGVDGSKTMTITLPPTARPGQRVAFQETNGLATALITISAGLPTQKIHGKGQTAVPLGNSVVWGPAAAPGPGTAGIAALIPYASLLFEFDGVTWWGLA